MIMLIQILSELYTTRTFKASHIFNGLLVWYFFCAKLLNEQPRKIKISTGISKKKIEADNM